MRFKNLKGKLERKNLKRTIFTSGGLVWILTTNLSKTTERSHISWGRTKTFIIKGGNFSF